MKALSMHTQKPYKGNFVLVLLAVILLKGTATLMISMFYQKELYEP